MADANPGSECDAALAGLSVDAIPPDHGGPVFAGGNGEALAEFHLQGVEDAVDPLTTTNTADTGTVRPFLNECPGLS